MSNSFWDHPISTIEKALNIRKQIEALQASLSEIYSGSTKSVSPKAAKAVDGAKPDRRKGKRSAAARAKMAAAQKARWAKKRAGAPKATPAEAPAKGKKKRKTMSPEARAKIAAAQRARWAKQKAA